MRSAVLVVLVSSILYAGAGVSAPAAKLVPVVHSDAEWRRLLTPEEYRVLRTEGTERPFSGKLLNEHRRGSFTCAGCALPLFSSKTKYDSGTGWPSFWQPIASGNVRLVPESSLGMRYEEVECARCGGHLGHVFSDGPKPTGLRYCMNSVAIRFVAAR